MSRHVIDVTSTWQRVATAVKATLSVRRVGSTDAPLLINDDDSDDTAHPIHAAQAYEIYDQREAKDTWVRSDSSKPWQIIIDREGTA